MSSTFGVDEVTGHRGQSLAGKVLISQEFWVTMAVAIMAAYLATDTEAFDSWRNIRNSLMNMSFIGIIALGQICVIITGGIDLSVGSVMAVGAVGTGLMMQGGYGIEVSFLVGIGFSMAVGLFNGSLVAFVRLPPFVVTLGTLSICRTIAMAATNNQLIYQFGPDENDLFWLGTGGIASPYIMGEEFEGRPPLVGEGLASFPVPFLVLLVLTFLLSYFLYLTRWGRHLYAVGGNEQAARMTGVPVAFIKVSAYVLCSSLAGLSGILLMGWSGSLNNSIGLNYELEVIAAGVIGGANLMGGSASAFGAFIGAGLLEILRNSLVLLKIDPNFHLGFVGLFIILAVLLERLRDSSANLRNVAGHLLRRPK